ncbi:MAG TPA: phosphate/phosphite/phosphonate ABC transporter substrate-binding protein [Geobacteraceae bacterium]
MVAALQNLRVFRLMLLLPCLALAWSAVGCSRSDRPEISLEGRVPFADSSSVKRGTPLRIGMGAMITPKEGYVYYSRLKDYLAGKLNMPVTLVDRENYEEMNYLLDSGGVDSAFVCAGPYVEGHDKYGLEILVMPLVKGEPVYHSYIIVPRESPVQHLEELRGKSFAFTDPQSNSGKLVPTYILARMGESPDTFFDKYWYTYGHDKSITAVAEKLVDGAAVDSLIWEYLNREKPDLTRKTRIVNVSEPYGIPPLVVRKGLDPKLKERLGQALVNMANDPEGKKILAGMMIDRFVPGDDRNYDSVRAINRFIAKQKLGKP